MPRFSKAVISWSHTDPGWDAAQVQQRANDVHLLANLLRTSGIDVVVDLHRAGGVDWPRFGPSLISEPERAVIIIASEAWRSAWEGTGDPTRGAGAAGEADVLRSLYNEDRNKFIERTFLVALPGTDDDAIPRGLLVTQCHLASLDQAGIEPLLRNLLAQPFYPAAPLGPVPVLGSAEPDGSAEPEGDRTAGSGATHGPGSAGSVSVGADGHSFGPLQSEPEIRWSMPNDSWSGPTQPVLAVHVLPDPSRRLTRRQLVSASEELTAVVRRHHLVPDSEPVNVVGTTDGIAVLFAEPRYSRQTVMSQLTGIELDTTGAVTVSRSLPRDSMGAVVDADAVESDVAEALRIASYLLPPGPGGYALGFEIGPTASITAGTVADFGRNNATLPKTQRGPMQLDPDEAVQTTDLARDARAIATDLAPAIMRAWHLH